MEDVTYLFLKEALYNLLLVFTYNAVEKSSKWMPTLTRCIEGPSVVTNTVYETRYIDAPAPNRLQMHEIVEISKHLNDFANAVEKNDPGFLQRYMEKTILLLFPNGGQGLHINDSVNIVKEVLQKTVSLHQELEEKLKEYFPKTDYYNLAAMFVACLLLFAMMGFFWYRKYKKNEQFNATVVKKIKEALPRHYFSVKDFKKFIKENLDEIMEVVYKQVNSLYAAKKWKEAEMEQGKKINRHLEQQNSRFSQENHFTRPDWSKHESMLYKFKVYENEGGGDCQFSSIKQAFDLTLEISQLRIDIYNYYIKHKDVFDSFFYEEQNRKEYWKKMTEKGWGDDLTLNILRNMYKVNIILLDEALNVRNCFSSKAFGNFILLQYYQDQHYKFISVINKSSSKEIKVFTRGDEVYNFVDNGRLNCSES